MPAKPRNRASLDAEAVARMMAAQEEGTTAEAPDPEPAPNPPVEAAVMPAAPTRPKLGAKPKVEPPVAFDPGKVDGRTLRRTGREPFATRIKPEAHEALKRIAHARGITMAEALELAVAAFTVTDILSHDGR